MGLGYDLVITISGIVLVFLVLILLMAIIVLEGKIFSAIQGKGKGKPAAEKPAEKQAPKPAPKAQAAAPAAPAVEAGIPPEVVAVIAAAVCAMGGGRYTLRAVRRADKGSWARAGISDATAPF